MDFAQQHKGGALTVDDQLLEHRRQMKDPPKARAAAAPKKPLDAYTVEHNRKVSAQARGFVSSFERHKKYMKDVVHYYGGKVPKAAEGENDFAILQRNFQFIRDEYDDVETLEEGTNKEKYEAEISLAYYQKLHKEYALANLTRFETGEIGLMWRTDQQVISGKGQFVCGNVDCDAMEGLKEFEMEFGYKENEQQKLELVKISLCPVCAYKLNYKRIQDKEKQERKRKRKEEKKAKKRKKRKL